MCKDDVDPTYLPLAPKGNYPADPFGHLAKMHDLYMEGMAHREYSPRRIEIAKEMSRILTEQKYMMAINIGGGSNRGLFLKRNNLRNVPRQAWATRAVGTWPQVYYFEDGIDNMNNPGTRSRRYDSENLIKFAE
jgi:exopolysaccharide biosynthesis predicted pyruvyltransferase EpsI